MSKSVELEETTLVRVAAATQCSDLLFIDWEWSLGVGDIR
jgi:hypothetical protein